MSKICGKGEVPQYYVEGNHEAIISQAVFDLVQDEMAKRTNCGSRYSGVSIFSNKIKCADCGGWFGSKVWHATDRYRRVIYRCNRKYNGEKCQTLHVTEEEVKAAFVSAYNKLVIEDFDESLWGCMVECVTVSRNKGMTVVFRDGTEIQV